MTTISQFALPNNGIPQTSSRYRKARLYSSFVGLGHLLLFELRIQSLDEPNFANLATAPVVAQAGFAVPDQR